MLRTTFIITSNHTENTSSIKELENTLKSCVAFAEKHKTKIPNLVLNYGPLEYNPEKIQSILPHITAMVQYANNSNIQTLYQIAPNEQLTSLAKTLTLNWFILNLSGQEMIHTIDRIIVLQAGQTIDEGLENSILFSLQKQKDPSIFLPTKQISNLSAKESKQVFFKRNPKAWGFDTPTTPFVLKMLSDMASHIQSSFDHIHCLDFEHALFAHTPVQYVTEDQALQKELHKLQ